MVRSEGICDQDTVRSFVQFWWLWREGIFSDHFVNRRCVMKTDEWSGESMQSPENDLTASYSGRGKTVSSSSGKTGRRTFLYGRSPGESAQMDG